MALKLEYSNEEEILYSDNTLVGRTKYGYYFFSIFVTDKGASISRYCVPGRIDTYSFAWVPGSSSGIGDRLTYFTDISASLSKSFKLVGRDLKKKQVKQLLKEIKGKLGERSYFSSLLNALR